MPKPAKRPAAAAAAAAADKPSSATKRKADNLPEGKEGSTDKKGKAVPPSQSEAAPAAAATAPRPRSPKKCTSTEDPCRLAGNGHEWFHISKEHKAKSDCPIYRSIAFHAVQFLMDPDTRSIFKQQAELQDGGGDDPEAVHYLCSTIESAGDDLIKGGVWSPNATGDSDAGEEDSDEDADGDAKSK
jgi:hypothetical protein